MTIDRERLAVEGNERLDIPDVRRLIDAPAEDMQRLIRLFIDASARRVVKNYTQGTHVGLSFKIALDTRRGFYDVNQEWVVKTPDSAGTVATLALAPSSTNYVEVKVSQFTDNPQPRAFWDVDIGLTGEEFFDTINIRKRVEEGFQSNTTGFTAGAIPLFTVVTSPSAITSVDASPQDLLWHPRALSLPAAAVRATAYNSLGDLRSFIDFLGALAAEQKGTGQLLESKPWSSIKLLRENENAFVTSSPVVTFEGDFGADQINWATDITLSVAGRTGVYTVLANTFTLLDGKALYVVIPETAPATLTPVVVDIDAVPINPTAAGQAPTIKVLFMRRGALVRGVPGLEPYQTPLEETIALVDGVTDYTLTLFTVNASNNVYDTQVWADGIYQPLNGAGTEGFKKQSTTVLRLSEAPSVPAGIVKEIFVRKQGTGPGGGGGGGGSADFSNIPVAPRPNSAGAGALDLGTLTRPWASVIMKDSVTNQVWQLTVTSGAIQAVQIGTYP